MIVVSDSTPLITLMKAQQLSVLHGLFGDVVIPEAVYDEVTGNTNFQDEADLIKSSSFIKVVKVSNPDHVSFLQRATGLDKGESEAIVYADEVKADVLLMDEVAGRRVAINMKLPISGSVGVIIQAKKRGLLSLEEAEATLNRIENLDRHISKRLLDDARNAIRE